MFGLIVELATETKFRGAIKNVSRLFKESLVAGKVRGNNLKTQNENKTHSGCHANGERCRSYGASLLPFRGWNSTKEKSADIVIVRCIKTPQRSDTRAGTIISDMEIEFVLKGKTNLGPAKLSSFYWPRQDEHYLVFSTFDEGIYHATEEFRIIPLDVDFSTDSIAGKTFDQQIQLLFKRRLWKLNRELERGQDEKQRLEEGLKK